MKFPWVYTDDRRDSGLSFAVWGCALVAVLLVGERVAAALGYATPTLDAAVIGAILVPTLGAYVARRATDRANPDMSTSASTRSG